MKRRSVSQNRELPWLSVPVPCTWATPTKPLKLVIVLGSPPTRPVLVLSAGPGSWKWMSGPPSRWKFGMAPGTGTGVPLGKLRPSSTSRDGLVRVGGRHAYRARRRGDANSKEVARGRKLMVALLERTGLRRVGSTSLGAQTGRRVDAAPSPYPLPLRGGEGRVRGKAGADLSGRQAATGRFASPRLYPGMTVGCAGDVGG